MEMLNERWKPVQGYEGRYAVSDHGQVKSLKRFRTGKAGAPVPMEERVMRANPKKLSAAGRTRPYMEIKLRDGSPRDTPCKSFLVHRLVAQAFVSDLLPGLQVDHIDGDHQNNHFTNLRVLTTREHGLLHPCLATPEAKAALQAAAQTKIALMRAAGEIVGRLRVH